MHNNNAADFFAFMWAVLFFFLYFVPYFVSKSRQMATRGWLLVILILTGWTVAGWIMCMIWAVVGQTDDQVRFYQRRMELEEIALQRKA